MTSPAFNNIEAERALLGAVLIGGVDVWADVDRVVPGDFHLHHHRWIWDALRRIEAAGEEIDIITVTNELDQHGHLAEAGGAAYLTRLMGEVPTSMNAGQYAKIIRDLAAKQTAIDALAAAANDVAGANGNLGQVLERTASVFAELSVGVARPGSSLGSDIVTAAEIADSDPRPVDWLTYKFIERNELVLITAPPGGMKSLLTLHWAARVACGQPWLARADGSNGLATKPARVLWLNTDNGVQTHNDRLGAILRTLGQRDIPLFSLTRTNFELSNHQHVVDLQLLATELDADVIVIDTLSGCLAGVNENSAEEMTTPAAHLRELASSGRTVIGIHHPPKNDSEGSRGSSVLTGKVDRHFTVGRRGDMLTIKPAKIRNSPSLEFTIQAAIETDPATGALLGVGFFDGADAVKRQEIEDAKSKVIDALDAGPMNKRALRKAVKGHRNDIIDAAVSALLLARSIQMTAGARGAKVYQLTDITTVPHE